MSFPLNDGQREAAFTLEGPVLIAAGAGTGKTRALTERFVNAVVPGRVDGWEAADVDSVLTITFTDKAAGELAERIRGALRGEGRSREARELDGAWISTIHGFCARLLRRHALEAGLDPGFAVADETEARQLREEAFEHAASDAHRSSAAVSGLFALYGFQSVWEAVETLTRELETRGLSPADVLVEPEPDVVALLGEARQFFAWAEAELTVHECVLKGAANHAGACRTLLERLEELDASQGGATDVALELWRALAEYSARGGSGAAIRDVCDSLAETRDRLVAEAVSALTQAPARALVELAEGYLEALACLKAERGILDFADLQLHAARLLESRPDLRERYRHAFRLVMVDEFQDTDELQMRIVAAVAKDNLCTVGDERQSIYRFRGADLDVYRRHRAEMADAGARSVELVENYRSHRDIIGFVNRVFGSEPLFGAGLLRLEARRAEPAPAFLPPDTPRISADIVHAPGRTTSGPFATEAEAVAARMSELRDAGVSAGDMVVLVRRYASADPIAAALRRAGFPVLVVGGRQFLELPEVAMVRALCRVIANPLDDGALARLLLSAFSAVSDDGVWMLRNAEGAAQAGRHLWDALAVAESLLDPGDAEAAVAVRDAVTRARERAGALPLGEVLMRAIEESEADLVLLSRGDEGLQAFANVLRFVRKADDFERAGGAGAAAFMARVDAEERFGGRDTPSAVTDDGSPAVRIMSVHASKGLEFPVVVLPMLGESGRPDAGVLRTRPRGGRLEIALSLPSAWGGKAEQRRGRWFREMQDSEARARSDEAERLLYVACTRAREALVLSGAANLERAPGDGAASGLGLLRSALGSTLAAGAGTDEMRTLEDGTRIAVRIHEVVDEPGGLAGVPSSEHVDQRPVEPGAPGAGRVHADSGARPVATGADPVRPERLSYSDISLFEACPLRYWAQSVARLGEIGRSAESDPMRLGSALHAVLQLGTAGSGRSGLERVEAIARYHGLGEHDHERLAAAAERYGRSSTARALSAHQVVRREHPFAVRIRRGAHEFDLVGAMDAYGRTGEEGLVVDYKSGASDASADELRARYETQAECYGYAALKDGCRRVRVVFVRPEVAGTDGEPEHVTFEFSARDAERIEAGLISVYEDISGAPYRPLSAWDETVCGGCRISGSLCPLTPPGRGAG